MAFFKTVILQVHYLMMQKDKDKQMEWIQEKYQNVWQIH